MFGLFDGNINLSHIMLNTNYSNFFLTFQSLTVRDTVRECLEKDPALRTEEDVNIILEYMQHLPVSYSFIFFEWTIQKDIF